MSFLFFSNSKALDRVFAFTISFSEINSEDYEMMLRLYELYQDKMMSLKQTAFKKVKVNGR